MRRRVIINTRDAPIPTDPYLKAIPDMIWVTDDISNYFMVLSNTNWIVE